MKKTVAMILAVISSVSTISLVGCGGGNNGGGKGISVGEFLDVLNQKQTSYTMKIEETNFTGAGENYYMGVEFDEASAEFAPVGSITYTPYAYHYDFDGQEFYLEKVYKDGVYQDVNKVVNENGTWKKTPFSNYSIDYSTWFYYDLGDLQAHISDFAMSMVACAVTDIEEKKDSTKELKKFYKDGYYSFERKATDVITEEAFGIDFEYNVWAQNITYPYFRQAENYVPIFGDDAIAKWKVKFDANKQLEEFVCYYIDNRKSTNPEDNKLLRATISGFNQTDLALPFESEVDKTAASDEKVTAITAEQFDAFMASPSLNNYTLRYEEYNGSTLSYYADIYFANNIYYVEESHYDNGSAVPITNKFYYDYSGSDDAIPWNYRYIGSSSGKAWEAEQSGVDTNAIGRVWAATQPFTDGFGFESVSDSFEEYFYDSFYNNYVYTRSITNYLRFENGQIAGIYLETTTWDSKNVRFVLSNVGTTSVTLPAESDVEFVS